MSDFAQAIKWLQEGKKIRRKFWERKYFLYSKNSVLYREDGTERPFTDFEMLGTIDDWEIYEEPKQVSLSKMIFSLRNPLFVDGVEDNNVLMRTHVKEKIQNAQVGLRDEFIKESTKNEDGTRDVHLYKISKVIDKIFKEEFGDDLIK